MDVKGLILRLRAVLCRFMDVKGLILRLRAVLCRFMAVKGLILRLCAVLCRFMDAMGEGMKICPHCQASIFALSGFEEHVATHFGRICPICKSQADNDMSPEDFERHVNRCCELVVNGEEDAGQ